MFPLVYARRGVASRFASPCTRSCSILTTFCALAASLALRLTPVLQDNLSEPAASLAALAAGEARWAHALGRNPCGCDLWWEPARQQHSGGAGTRARPPAGRLLVQQRRMDGAHPDVQRLVARGARAAAPPPLPLLAQLLAGRLRTAACRWPIAITFGDVSPEALVGVQTIAAN
jgi:hypothetical protein